MVPPFSYQQGAERFPPLLAWRKQGRHEMDTAASVHEILVENTHDPRDLAEQCYLPIGLTRDARVKSHLLDLGLELEQRIGSIERRLAL